MIQFWSTDSTYRDQQNWARRYFSMSATPLISTYVVLTIFRFLKDCNAHYVLYAKDYTETLSLIVPRPPVLL